MDKKSVGGDRSPLHSLGKQDNNRQAPGRGIQEETLALVEKLFLNVHIKNPILDASDTRIMAKDVMEHGFKWDASSCLVT
ncbi:hypothetical protein FOTG_15661 [Fusarium oxysporum f. sp. vasinfectum 25433]|uniref:Uncharacterized protein n=1 Tax=Fusarium oxysporum f. sp. vasinfectum 25433 TaxID=1089449 RepID=X0KR00_FUSOX|nr:hypothetical protein FOTG_15661 [Fusarium oxysporum f. sp. vasinfectum 25433]